MSLGFCVESKCAFDTFLLIKKIKMKINALIKHIMRIYDQLVDSKDK